MEHSNSIGTNGGVFHHNASIIYFDMWPFTGITTLPNYGQIGTFTSCTALQTVILPLNLKATSANMFSYCTALKKVVFPEGLTSIGSSLLYRSANNITLDLPSTLKTIHSNFISVSSNTGSTAVLLLRCDVKEGFEGLKNSRVLAIYVPDDYLANYQAFLTGHANLSKLHPMSEYVEG